jgi:hypothetical protein
MIYAPLNPREFVIATEANGCYTQLAWKDDDGSFHWMFYTTQWEPFPWPEDWFLNYLTIFPAENICRFYMDD